MNRSVGLLAACAAVGVLAAAPNAAAQSRQPWSVQGSALYTAQDFGGQAGTIGGFGFEAQARRTFPGFSIGAGVQYSRHTSGPDALNLTGIFVEPRYVPSVTMGPFAPYLAGRVVFLRGSLNSELLDASGSSNGFAFGAGAGLIYPMTRRVNFDIGGAVLRQSLGNMTLDDAGELEVEFPSFLGYVVKAGFSIGFESGASSARNLLRLR
jgi:opacity protein-like surface antigen